MAKSTKEKSVMKAVKIFKANGTKEGDKVAVHILRRDQQFVQLSFKEKIEPANVYDFNAIINYDVKDFKENQSIVSFFEKVEKNVLLLNGVYSSYNYLFTIIDNKPYLFSITVSNLVLDFEIVKQIGEKLNVEVLSPNWLGTYSFALWAVFYDDIFIQNL